jgi:hypothetical protein
MTSVLPIAEPRSEYNEIHFSSNDSRRLMKGACSDEHMKLLNNLQLTTLGGTPRLPCLQHIEKATIIRCEQPNMLERSATTLPSSRLDIVHGLCTYGMHGIYLGTVSPVSNPYITAVLE